VDEYGNLARMVTHVFFEGLAPNETTEFTIEDGKTLIIQLVGLGEANDDGTRNVIFNLNGARREVAIQDKAATATVTTITLADVDDKSQVGASIPGAVSKISVKEGDTVAENQVIAIIEAMKMETSVVSRMAGVVHKIHVNEGQSVKAGELLITVD